MHSSLKAAETPACELSKKFWKISQRSKTIFQRNPNHFKPAQIKINTGNFEPVMMRYKNKRTGKTCKMYYMRPE